MIKASLSLNLQPSENVKKSLVKKVIRQSVTRNSTPILQAVRSNVRATKRTGNLYKSLTKKVKTYGEVVVSVIGPKSQFQITLGVYVKGKRVGQSKIYRPSKIFHLIERGTKRVSAKHPLERARDTTSNTFAENVTRDVREGIQKLAP